MNPRNTLQIAAAVLVAFTAAPGFAADSDVPARGPVPFEAFDKDGNGSVNQEEFGQVHRERAQAQTGTQNQYRNRNNAPGFSDLDTDGNGNLDRDEVQAHQRERQQSRDQTRQENHERNRMNRAGANGAGMGGGRGGMSSGGGMGGRK